MHVIGRIAGGEYSRHAGSAGGVDQYAVVHRYLGALQDSHSRQNADGYNRQLALQLSSLPRDGAFDPAGTFEPDHLVAVHELDPCVAMDARHDLAHLRAEDGLERSSSRKYSAHVNAHLGQGGGHLRADEPHSNHDTSSATSSSLLDRIAFPHGSELKDPRQIGTGDLQAPVLAARRDQQLFIHDGLALVQLDLLRADVDARRGGVPQLDVVFLVSTLCLVANSRYCHINVML